MKKNYVMSCDAGTFSATQLSIVPRHDHFTTSSELALEAVSHDLL